jgi:NAD(P)-dependent dehydrogenase (short-subunit alcohol dehydrogenase family)
MSEATSAPHADAPVAVVTGAAGGIGLALVAAFEAAGWRVVSTDRTALPRAAHLVADLAALTDPQQAAHRETVDALRRLTGGRARALVANAACQVVRPSADLSAADWQQTLAVNLLAPFWLAMALRDELAANQGSFLAISSIHERLTKPGFVAYATSKAALSGLVRALAVDIGAQVRCNAICPAAIATPMLVAGFDSRPQALEQLHAHHPVGRIGTPEEVAALAVFACSPAAGFLNGACLDLSGGISSRLHDPA